MADSGKKTADSRQNIMLMGVWQDAATDSAPITRISIKDKTQDEIAGFLRDLQGAGLTPALHVSGSMGQTIRLTGGDVEKIRDMRRGLIAAQEWEASSAGGIIMRTVKGQPDIEKMMAVGNALEGEGLRPRSCTSPRMGLTLHIGSRDEDVQRVHDLLDKFGPKDANGKSVSKLRVLRPPKFRSPGGGPAGS